MVEEHLEQGNKDVGEGELFVLHIKCIRILD